MAEAAQAPIVEEVKNCPACKKPLKKARRFYRNGAYYCNNNCFKKVQAAAKAEASKVPEEPKAVLQDPKVTTQQASHPSDEKLKA